MEVVKHITTAVLLALLAIVYGILIFEKVLKVMQDAKEPPFIPSTIPYFGHIIGLIRFRTRSYANLR
jgi:hypothetical protein